MSPMLLPGGMLTERSGSFTERGGSVTYRANTRRLLRKSHEEKTYGAVVLEMAGACWVLPEFSLRLGKLELVETFKV